MLEMFKNLFGPKTNYKELIVNGAVIIDVRTPQEFNSGHIQGSKNIPLDQLKNKLHEIRKYGKPVITVCASGIRSGAAKTMLLSNNIEAYNGGSWTNLRNI